MLGTIGGGQLEHQALAQAREYLSASAKCPKEPMRFALGPSMGQCCGGVMYLSFELLGQQDLPLLQTRLPADRVPVALFGGGHVGHALIAVLQTLPFKLTWIDSREGIFPPDLALDIVREHSEPVQAAVATLTANSRVLIMSFSHAEDIDVVAACLKRHREQADLPYIGLIGSKTKWASFRQRLQARGFSESELAHVTCPIGIAGIEGKEPEVIAVSVAAQLLQMGSQSVS